MQIRRQRDFPTMKRANLGTMLAPEQPNMDFIPDELKPIITVLVTIGGLVTPVVTLVRWLQERDAVQRNHNELQRSLQLLDFITRCPEMITATGFSDGILERAKAELSHSLTRIDDSLKASATLRAPRQFNWFRRWFSCICQRDGGL